MKSSNRSAFCSTPACWGSCRHGKGNANGGSYRVSGDSGSVPGPNSAAVLSR